jgi:hypothetical protein
MSNAHPARGLLLAAALLTALPAAGAVRRFPGGAPCNTTVQACIDGAAPGDVVELATTTPIAETLQVTKSLTLRPASGFTPVIADLHAIVLLNPAHAANTIDVEGLRLTRGFVSALQLSEREFDVKVSGLEIDDTFNGNTAIDVDAGTAQGPLGPIGFEVSGNEITIPPEEDREIAGIVVFGGPATAVHGVVRDNTIHDFFGGEQGAIEVANAQSALDVDVVANRISGTNFNDGVIFDQFDEGQARVRMVDNLVTGQVSVAGAPAAFVADVTSGSADVAIVNNTAANSDAGILVGGRADLGATLSGVVANNIVAHMTQSGIGIEGGFDVENESNLVFDTVLDVFNPGPGTLHADPRFVGGGDFHLNPFSPAIDAGNAGRVPAGITTDLDGLPRVVGRGIDLGAFEQLQIGRCALIPVSVCHARGRPGLRLRADGGTLAWQWKQGPTEQSEFGIPMTTTDYALCLYDERNGVPTVVGQAVIPAGAGWKAAAKGFRYRSASGARDGVRRLVLAATGRGQASLQVEGRAMTLPTLPLAQDPQVVTQLVNSDGSCWEAAFSAPADRNDSTRFTAHGE